MLLDRWFFSLEPRPVSLQYITRRFSMILLFRRYAVYYSYRKTKTPSQVKHSLFVSRLSHITREYNSRNATVWVLFCVIQKNKALPSVCVWALKRDPRPCCFFLGRWACQLHFGDVTWPPPKTNKRFPPQKIDGRYIAREFLVNHC